MRMKEICSRTGLTDRAVRLYIENGLLSPQRVSGYSGRESIIFDEENLLMLRQVAVLRRAGFAIADIKKMQDEPGCIMETVAAYREQIGEEIKQKKEIFDQLEKVFERKVENVAALADIVSSAAEKQKLPREDIMPARSEVYDTLSRVAAAFSLISAVAGSLFMIVIMVLVLLYSDGGMDMFPGGIYELTNVFTPGRLFQYWVFFPITAGFIGMTGGLYVYIKQGRFRALLIALILTVAVCMLLFFIPDSEYNGGLGTWEGIFVRKIIHLRLPSLSSYAYYSFAVPAIKFLPFALSFLCSGVAAILKTVAFVKIRAVKPDKVKT